MVALTISSFIGSLADSTEYHTVLLELLVAGTGVKSKTKLKGYVFASTLSHLNL